MNHLQLNIKRVQEECDRRHKRNNYRHHSEGELYIDNTNLWKMTNA